ncbi:predicted protein [Chaetoceros tenuissimus]|uniref:Uncharacterized protein n=1 Tax=Chaetoceros tenuissimus TaxID=426638 RepID=A0AAD3D4D6_9STRA|nr:predicted protein [Chaetoceros tenuissimus]
MKLKQFAVLLPILHLCTLSTATAVDDTSEQESRSVAHFIRAPSIHESSIRNLVQRKTSNEMCLARAEVDCIILETKEPCTNVIVDYGSCGLMDSVFTYKYCNEMDTYSINIKAGATEAKLNLSYKSEIGELDVTNLPPNTCRVFEKTHKLDTCKKFFAASLKFEGWVKDHELENGFYCYAWAFIKHKFLHFSASPSLRPSTGQSNAPTMSSYPSLFGSSVPSLSNAPSVQVTKDSSSPPSIAPTKIVSTSPSAVKSVSPTMKLPTGSPSILPTETPTHNPSAQTLQPSLVESAVPATFVPTLDPSQDNDVLVTMNIQCFGEPQGFPGMFVLPCEFLTSLEDESGCNRELKYIVALTNESREAVIVERILFAAKGMMQETVASSIDIAPMITRKVEVIVNVDLCVDGVLVSSIAVGVGKESNTPFFSEYNIQTPSIEFPPNLELLTPVPCFVRGVPCKNFKADIDDCEVPVQFEYHLSNTGTSCVTISCVTSTFDERIQNVSLEGIDKTFCSGEVLVLQDFRSINICQYGGKHGPVDVIFNTHFKLEGTVHFPLSFRTAAPTTTVGPSSSSPTPTTVKPTALLCTIRPRFVSLVFIPQRCVQKESSAITRKMTVMKKKRSEKRKTSEKKGAKVSHKDESPKEESSCHDHSPAKPNKVSRVVVATIPGGDVLFDDLIHAGQTLPLLSPNYTGFRGLSLHIHDVHGELYQAVKIFFITEVCVGHSFGSILVESF